LIVATLRRQPLHDREHREHTTPSANTRCVEYGLADFKPVAARGRLFHSATIHEDFRPAYMTIVALFRLAVPLCTILRGIRNRPASQFGDGPRRMDIVQAMTPSGLSMRGSVRDCCNLHCPCPRRLVGKLLNNGS
jgi:hypothetical protein